MFSINQLVNIENSHDLKSMIGTIDNVNITRICITPGYCMYCLFPTVFKIRTSFQNKSFCGLDRCLKFNAVLSKESCFEHVRSSEKRGRMLIDDFKNGVEMAKFKERSDKILAQGNSPAYAILENAKKQQDISLIDENSYSIVWPLSTYFVGPPYTSSSYCFAVVAFE